MSESVLHHDKRVCTHCDAVSLRVVSLIVRVVDSVLANNESHTYGERKFVVFG
jgi:hypothetical protein